jgi:hypothetical protein
VDINDTKFPFFVTSWCSLPLIVIILCQKFSTVASLTKYTTEKKYEISFLRSVCVRTGEVYRRNHDISTWR